MRTLRTILTLATFSMALIFSTSCSNEAGCMDADSKNFNPAAEEDDGSCEFEGQLVFWYDQAASNGLINNYTLSLIYFVDGVVVGSSATTVYWTGAPTCNQSGSITVTKSLGNVKT